MKVLSIGYQPVYYLIDWVAANLSKLSLLQLQGSLGVLQQHHNAIPVRAFAKEAARPTFKGDG